MRIFPCLRSSAFEAVVAKRVAQAQADSSDPLNKATEKWHKALHMHKDASRDFWRASVSFAFEKDGVGVFPEEQRNWLSKQFGLISWARHHIYPHSPLIQHASFPPQTFPDPARSATDLSLLIAQSPTASLAYDTAKIFQARAQSWRKYREQAPVLPLERGDYLRRYTAAVTYEMDDGWYSEEDDDEKAVAVVSRALALRDEPVLVKSEEIIEILDVLQKAREEERERKLWYEDGDQEYEWEEDKDEDKM